MPKMARTPSDNYKRYINTKHVKLQIRHDGMISKIKKKCKEYYIRGINYRSGVME